MPALEFEFEVFCENCGEGLCNLCTEGKTRGRGMPFISVKPCAKCYDKCDEDGHKRGYDEGYKEAKEEYETKTA